ncbi:MAG: DUF192 domain-containing protein [Gammaproteobacteria bacterium]|jgi:uncharacterized membrane protein (UPF0127 family)
MRRSFSPLLVLLVFLFACRDAASSQETLSIHTASGSTVTYVVELAMTSAMQRRGLMRRESLAANGGMLFIYRPPRRVSMWMKNTLLPLDMLFIDKRGRIVKIAANTKPLSTDLIPSESKISAVLEINAGQAVRRGIKVGDRVEWQGSE